MFPLRVPPLRDRREDIPALAAHFVDVNRRRLGLGAVRLTAGTLAELSAAPWPGNVRELDNVVSRAVLRASAGRDLRLPLTIDAHRLDLVPGVPGPAEDHAVPLPAPRAGLHLRAQVEDVERRLILAAVERNDGNWAAAARELGMHRSNLHQLARRLGLLDQRRARPSR